MTRGMATVTAGFVVLKFFRLHAFIVAIYTLNVKPSHKE